MKTLIGVIGPGQITKARPDIGSFEKDAGTGSYIKRVLATTTAFLGPELTEMVLAATPEKLVKNTRLAQDAAYVETMIMFGTLMRYSGRGDPSLFERLRGALPNQRIAVSGDSCGTVSAAYFPAPTETLEDQLVKFARGLPVIDKRGELISKASRQEFGGGRSPEGGLSIIIGPNRATVDEILTAANAQMLREDPAYRHMPTAKVVKTNAPRIHGVTAISEATEAIKLMVNSEKGKLFYGSPNFFHDPEVMGPAARKFGDFLSKTWVPRASYTYVSNVTGRAMSLGWRIRRDLARCVDHPVAVYADSGNSVVKTFRQLGVTDVIVFNGEIANWLRGSEMQTHLITNFESMVAERDKILTVMYAVRTAPARLHYVLYSQPGKAA